MPPDTPPSPDRLLRVAAIAIQIVIALMWFALVMVLIAIPVVMVYQAEILAGLAAEGVSVASGRFLPLVTAVMAGGAGLAVLGILFHRRLLAIVRTVADDPFVPDNVRRLREMAWLLLAGEIGTFVVFGLGARWLSSPPKPVEGASLTTLIAVLSLFVLARVFARGTAMRDEIEGTV